MDKQTSSCKRSHHPIDCVVNVRNKSSYTTKDAHNEESIIILYNQAIEVDKNEKTIM